MGRETQWGALVGASLEMPLTTGGLGVRTVTKVRRGMCGDQRVTCEQTLHEVPLKMGRHIGFVNIELRCLFII